MKYLLLSLVVLNAVSCSKDTSDFMKKEANSAVNLSTGVTSGSGSGSGSGSSELPPAAAEEVTPKVPAPPVVTAPTAPSEKDICEPLKEEGDEIVYGHGLVGKLYDGAPNKIVSFKDLLEKGKLLEGLIYMSKLNIPTRKFDKGFPREDGTMVMNAMGKDLIENFGIEFTGSLELLPEDGPGYYEMGVISDDGTVLDIEVDGKNVSVISGDHTTPAKFFCSNQLVRMEEGKKVPMRLRYFQGPRYHIALIMIWRKVQSLEGETALLIKNQVKQPVKETRCGIAGNKFFFDPDSSSHPTQEYLDLFDAKKREVPWKIVQHKNLRLPDGYSNQECVTKKP